MNIHILGLGAVGSLLAHHIRSTLPTNTHNVTLLYRNAQRLALALQNGSSISVEHNGIRGTSRGYTMERADSQKEYDMKRHGGHLKNLVNLGHKSPSPEGRISTLFVATKAFNTSSAIKQILPRLEPHCTIVLMQNGMGVYEHLISEVFRNPQTRPKFIMAVNTHGSYVRGLSDVVQVGTGKIHYAIVPDATSRNLNLSLERSFTEGEPDSGSIDDIPYQDVPEYQSLHNTMSVLQSLKHTPLAASWVPMADLQLMMMRKLVVNAVINPLSALMNCRNGDLFRTEASKRIVKGVTREASMLFQKEMIADAQERLREQYGDHPSPADAQAFWDDAGRFPRSLEASQLEQECLAVARQTGGNLSSMLVDIRKGRFTEINFINGYLVGLAKKHQVRAPVISMLSNLVQMRSDIPLDQPL